MAYIIVPVAIVVALVAWVVSGLQTKKDLAAARRDRVEIYGSCFLRGLAGILAKMAKADGTVTLEEVNAAKSAGEKIDKILKA